MSMISTYETGHYPDPCKQSFLLQHISSSHKKTPVTTPTRSTKQATACRPGPGPAPSSFPSSDPAELNPHP